MSSIQDRLKLRRVSSFETWSTREQLCLASSVLKSGDQNWMSVSRSLKPFIEKELPRPSDWFSQRSCASQYTYLLENADMPRRKKRESGETPSESIVRKLTQERIAELNQNLVRQRNEYLRHKSDMNLLIKSGAIIDEMLQKMWLDIQQEECEKEQKARTHSVWIAKRQQKQEISLPSIPLVIGNQRKLMEGAIVEMQESSTEPSVEDDEKKNRGGRSPLLTSLLKSPSPTTQTQTTTSASIQSNSPTITSLLGSSSKMLNTQLAQNVSPQLQQLVSTAIASATNATLERPSVEAPTLSMLLEMPANSQRGPLPSLQGTPTATIPIAPQTTQQATVTTAAEMHNFPQAQQAQNVHQMAIQNVVTSTALAITTIPATTNNIPISENMVIIDHIDDVIRKDIMSDVMDKDEINEIIGDIEELIKEEITARSPQTHQDTSGNSTSTTTTTTVIDTLTAQTSQQMAEVPITVAIEARPEPRNVDESVSLSNSPQSEMAIEEIDSSTSNIAEIIGTVTMEPQEPKIIVAEMTETISNTLEEKSEASTYDERMILSEELVAEQENNDGEKEDVVEEKQLGAETKSLDTTLNVTETEENERDQLSHPKKIEKVAGEEEEGVEEKNENEEGETEMTISDDKDAFESAKERKDTPEDVEGDQQDVPSAEVISVSSEITNDLPSTEDTEKSQDISLILEDDEEGESSRSSESKKKATLEQIIENTVESTTESLESFKEEPVVLIKKEEIVVEVREESSVKEEEIAEETLQIYTEEFKKKEEEETMKDSSEDTTSSILQDIEIKEEEIEPANEIEDATINAVTIEVAQSIKSEPTVAADAENANVKKTESTEVELEEPKTEREVKTSTDTLSEEDKNENVEIKEEKKEKEDTKKDINSEQNVKKEIEYGVTSAGEETGELDEEESSLSKLSGGRAMKTYSKKQQNIAVDSEPENEGTGEGADYRAWKKAVMLVYNRLATHKYASIFLRPITEDHAPGYHTVIFRPMDLSTIKKNIDNGTIRSTMHFQRDVMLMFQNAIMYNKHDTFIYKMAISMQEECLQHMQILVQVTGEGTFRRETRTAASSSSDAGENSIKRKRSHITPSPHDTDSLRSKKRRKSEND
ncbi:PREDICTED: bromodomain-containing protein 8 isoform X2 [Dinoponera quadriceps]|uniref:Bromodomain-containing protein 8 isoform X2 n=1 Tax=Dinoponera quadriceps TaxID=609295 RepID=A0A6P3WZ47_DINQU|nr:PREDICTED: bromodomain-containing protein 8 isoform X2 [Dinoponera quadriceps]